MTATLPATTPVVVPTTALPTPADPAPSTEPILEPPIPPVSAGSSPRDIWHRHWRDVLIAVPIALSIVVLLAWNITGYPGATDDEGTYLAQAWAVRNGLGLAHYTYWYDHPPLGWIGLAALSWVPELISPDGLSVAAGRVAMLPVALVTLLLTYVVSRRLGLPRWGAALALLAYGLSPLAVTMMRQIYLDSFAVMWMMLALALALTPRRHLWAYAGAGAAAAVAVLSKETVAVVLPAVGLAVWQSTRRTGVRPWSVAAFVAGLVLVGAFYPLYASIKGELVPGEGHVSLLGAIDYQLHSRTGSGSAFTAGSNSNLLVHAWLYYDVVLPVGGVVAMVVALFIRRLRVPAVATLLLVLVAVRPGGYLPAMYVVQALPFLAIVLAGVIALTVGALLGARTRPARASGSPRPTAPWLAVRRVVGAVAVAVLGVVAVAYVAPRWYDGDRRAVVTNANATYERAAVWLRTNLTADSTVVTDDVLWLDVVRSGVPRENVIWFYKLDLDPGVAAQLPRGWRDVDYIVSTPAMREDPDAGSLPNVEAALRNSQTVVSFGNGADRIEIRRVIS